MTNILDNPLIRKYFGNETPGGIIHCDDPKTFQYQDWIAGNVLRSMQEPIRPGEKFLCGTSGMWRETENRSGFCASEFHPFSLRLPPSFQKKECGPGVVRNGIYECACVRQPAPEPERCACGQNLNVPHISDRCKPSEPVEEKIEWLIANMPDITRPLWREHLRALVRLARG